MYKIGTRVKKTHGDHDLGLTGVVVGYTEPKETDTYPYDLLIKADGTRALKDGTHAPVGNTNREWSTWWEPIIPDGSNVPSEVSIHELLDPKFYEQAEPLHAPT